MLNKKKFSFDGWSTGLQKLIIKVRPLRISDYSEISLPGFTGRVVTFGIEK